MLLCQACIFEEDASCPKSSGIEVGDVVVLNGAPFSQQTEGPMAAGRVRVPKMDVTMIPPNSSGLRLSLVLPYSGRSLCYLLDGVSSKEESYYWCVVV